MTASADDRLSKGRMMIAAYRTARLSQRPTLRKDLHQSHLARRVARTGAPQPGEPQSQIDIATKPAVEMAVDGSAPTGTTSVFAHLVNIAETEQTVRNETIHPVDAEPWLEVKAEVDCETPTVLLDQVCSVSAPAAAEDKPANPVPHPVTPTDADTAGDHRPPYDPPLAEIGFGPGMLIRLSQLGLHTIGDLAHADAEQLRSDLGHISRLIDIEAWINSARQSACCAPG